MKNRKTFWQPKGVVWFKHNDDSKLGRLDKKKREQYEKEFDELFEQVYPKEMIINSRGEN